MKGVAKIKGPVNPKVGETNFYEVTEFHKGTVVIDPNTVKWKLYQSKEGKWLELKGAVKTGKKVTYSFPQKWYGKQLLVEAYVYDAEGKTPPGLVVKPVLGPKKIVNTQILDANGGKITKPPKYGESITLKVSTENMLGETLKLSLWERDTISDKGHDPNGNTLLWSGTSKIVDNKGISTTKVVLSANMLILANKGMFDGAEHEYYLLVDGGKLKTMSATTQVISEQVLSPMPPAKKASTKATPAEESSILDQIAVKIKNAIGWDPIEVGGTTKAVVNKPEEIPRVEGILNAYFAKEEFTKETAESAGNYVYTFGGTKANNKTATTEEKAKVADAILTKGKINGKLKPEKRYTTKEAIVEALTKVEYGKDTTDAKTVEIKTFKLGANFIKINSAPLEEEVYLVANTFLLDGKEVSIRIKEKEAVLVAGDGDLPVLEAKENGTEVTILKAVVEKGTAKVKIKLRPKSDDDLSTWKEKLAGIKDGTHSYKFGSDGNNTKTAEEKKKIAGIIAGKIKTALDELKKFAKADVIEKTLTKEVYNKNEEITFDVYKRVIENLWLQAECQGDGKKHEGEYLKKDGEYFVLGKGKEIIFPLLVKPENDKENKWKAYYWAASQGGNQAAYYSNRGSRKHAGRDLYTEPLTPVVAICKGEVLEVKSFYAQTDQVTILHETNDGRKFIIRYGELDPSTVTVKKGDIVIQKQQLGVTGLLVGITVISGETVYMLHFEHFTGEKGYDLSTPLSTDDLPFKRRTDLVDSISILEEGYKNTFGEDTGEELFTVEDGKEAVTDLYNKYKDKTWKWKWEGSEEVTDVSGKDLVTIVEKMYRLETTHFTSKQYQNCGTGGMEAFGSAPYYGWDSSLFTEQPIGTWSAFEGKGLSGQGGNAQDTTKQKEFVKLPSVLVGMEYKIKYIIKYEGNYARWYNTNADAQEKYRKSLVGVKARFIESL